MKAKLLITILFATTLSLSAQTQIVQQANVIIQDDPATTSVVEGNLRVQNGITGGDATLSGTKGISIGNAQTGAGNYSLSMGENITMETDTSYSITVGKNITNNDSTNTFIMGNGVSVYGNGGTCFVMGNNMSLEGFSNSFIFR